MQPSDPISFVVLRRKTDGTASTGKTSSNFTVQGFKDGAAVSLTVDAVTEGLTYGPSGNQWRAYKFDIAALPSTAGYDQVFVWPDDTDLVWPDQLGGEVEAYDLNAMASLFLLAQGAPAVESAADSDLGQIVDGDSYVSPTLTLPAGKLSPHGITDLSAAGITVQSAIMDAVGGNSYPITCTVVSGPDLQVKISWDTQQHPALSGADEKTWYIDIQVLDESGSPTIIRTAGRYQFTQVWQRDTRTSS